MKMKAHEDNYNKFQQSFIESNIDLKSFKLIIEDLKAKSKFSIQWIIIL